MLDVKKNPIGISFSITKAYAKGGNLAIRSFKATNS
jgi:hypothetical protein